MNEKIFITGASSGIGEALAIEYAKRGAILGLCARRTEKLDDVANILNEITKFNFYEDLGQKKILQ